MALKVKFRTVFPALVEVESPIVLVKAGSVYTFSIDVDALAVAGNIGELISATIVAGSAVSLSTGSGITITSIVLTAGDWDISAQACVTGNASTTFTGVRASLSTTIATENTVAPFFNAQSFNAFALLGTFDYGCAISPIRVSISGSTTYYLIIRANFATSTCSGYGSIRARRVR